MDLDRRLGNAGVVVSSASLSQVLQLPRLGLPSLDIRPRPDPGQFAQMLKPCIRLGRAPKWVLELGQPVDCGLPEPVRLHTDGSWSYHFTHEEGSGQDFASLMAFVLERLDR